LQYDFTDNDYFADGTNPVPCSGGSPCPWHGTGAAHVAVARLNNRYGAAGTGGQVADAMLFKTSFDWGQVSAAIRTAVLWGADVISMSFRASCDNFFCDDFFESNLYPALRDARDNGVVMVAAAGNDSGSADGQGALQGR
jgi:serine protease